MLMLSERARSAVWAGVCALAFALSLSARADARWPPQSEADGVYGRFHGDTDVSLKLGGLVSEGRLSGSVGASAHYYSLVGISGDYSESLTDEAEHARSGALGVELKPLFLPRWLLGSERGPAWLDLTIDSFCLGFGAYLSDRSLSDDTTRGVWVSLGLGVPILAQATGPWLELRGTRRFPDPGQLGEDAHNALLLYLSWHQFFQLGPEPP